MEKLILQMRLRRRTNNTFKPKKPTSTRPKKEPLTLNLFEDMSAEQRAELIKMFEEDL